MRNLVLVGLLLAVFLGGGYALGLRQGQSVQQAVWHAQLRQWLSQEQASLRQSKEEIDSQLDALALQIGRLRAQVLRLNALGERLVIVGKLDPKEFDFVHEPPQGGIGWERGKTASARTLAEEIDELKDVLRTREHQLELLNDLLNRRQLHEQIVPSGRPVKKGFISSTFGMRTDPFTGKKKYHKGVDFVGQPGDEVLAVAAGVVIRSGVVSGYGNVVEIRHPEGYETRYAHNQENLVKVGDRVEKGETIALLGSTGRSSGPHVHFEVLRNGKVVNPAAFLKEKR